MDELLNIVQFIKEIIEQKQAREQKVYEEYIEKVFEDVQNIYVDLITILFYVKRALINNELSVEEAVMHIEKSRIPFKALRQQLNSKLIITFFNNKQEEDMFMFAFGARGILQGGMTGEYANDISFAIKLYLENLEVRDSILLYQGKHTLADLVEYFDKNNPLSIYYIKGKKNKEEYIFDKFKDAVNRQIMSIEEYWKLTTIAYEKIKYDRIKKK